MYEWIEEMIKNDYRVEKQRKNLNESLLKKACEDKEYLETEIKVNERRIKDMEETFDFLGKNNGSRK